MYFTEKTMTSTLKPCFMKGIVEAGIDEAGRGPMFGRVYAAAVVLPDEDEGSGFNFALMKDSKKFSSKKKIKEAYDHVKQYAKAYIVQFAEHDVIDSINIRNATFKAMHAAVKALGVQPDHLLVDGCDFKPYIYMGDSDDEYVSIANTCVEGGDNTYCSIAAASILAKVERDQYIEEMCDKYPKLDEYYGLRSNKGYGCKRQMDGIKQHGISRWHRRSFGICKTFDEYNDADSVVVDVDSVAKEDSPVTKKIPSEKTHICEICGKAYVRKGSLVTHMKTHADA
jgi:ribonuclease HII